MRTINFAAVPMPTLPNVAPTIPTPELPAANSSAPAVGANYGTVLPTAAAAETARANRRRKTGKGIFIAPAFISRQKDLIPIDGTTQEYDGVTFGPGSVFSTANETVGAAVAVLNPETGQMEVVCLLTNDGDDQKFLTPNVPIKVFGLRTERGMLSQYRF